MPIDAEMEQKLRRQLEAEGFSSASLEAYDNAQLAARDQDARTEKHKKWIKIMAGFVAASATGWAIDVIAIWLGVISKDMQLSSILKRALRSMF